MIQIFLADGTDGTDGTDGPTEGSTRGPRGPKKIDLDRNGIGKGFARATNPQIVIQESNL